MGAIAMKMDGITTITAIQNMITTTISVHIMWQKWHTTHRILGNMKRFCMNMWTVSSADTTSVHGMEKKMDMMNITKPEIFSTANKNTMPLIMISTLHILMGIAMDIAPDIVSISRSHTTTKHPGTMMTPGTKVGKLKKSNCLPHIKP